MEAQAKSSHHLANEDLPDPLFQGVASPLLPQALLALQPLPLHALGLAIRVRVSTCKLLKRP